MTDEEMLSMTSVLVDDARLEQYVPTYLNMAKGAVIARIFPFRDDADWTNVPNRHHMRTCEIACYLINRRGAEGETSHSENGTSRSYESAGIPESYFDGMIPFAGVPA